MQVGDLVVHRYDGPNGPVAQHGMVVVVHAEPDRAEVVWFAGASGPIAAEELEVLPRG